MVSGIVASLADHQIPTMRSDAERGLIALSHVVGCRGERAVVRKACGREGTVYSRVGGAARVHGCGVKWRPSLTSEFHDDCTMCEGHARMARVSTGSGVPPALQGWAV